MCGKCNLLKYSITLLSKALLNIFICETQCPKQKPRSLHCGYYVCSIMSNTTTYRRHPYRVSLNLFNLFICSLCLDMLTVFIYAHYFYICSLFSYMLTVFIYAHCVQICLNLFSCSGKMGKVLEWIHTKITSWSSSATFATS